MKLLENCWLLSCQFQIQPSTAAQQSQDKSWSMHMSQCTWAQECSLAAPWHERKCLRNRRWKLNSRQDLSVLILGKIVKFLTTNMTLMQPSYTRELQPDISCVRLLLGQGYLAYSGQAPLAEHSETSHESNWEWNCRREEVCADLHIQIGKYHPSPGAICCTHTKQFLTTQKFTHKTYSSLIPALCS